jgi:bile acid:Na+ symporter, BASS family
MKTLLLIATIFVGIIFPFAHSYSFMIKYLLMIMLFFSFLKMDVKREHFSKSHVIILLINLIVPIFAYFLILSFNLELAQVVFITAIAPTAIASPIIVSLLNGKIEFTVISILVTNFCIAFLLPILLPAILINSASISVIDVLVPVATIFLIPYGLAQLVKHYSEKLKTTFLRSNKYIFYILVININLGTSKASEYIKQEMSFADPIIYQIGIASLLLCILYFYLGRVVTPRELKIEGGQSLGQKNNGFTVWVALTFISPLAVLGPVFYILFQNIYISWQLHSKKSE